MGDVSLPPQPDPNSWSVPTSPPTAGWPAAGPPVTPPPPSGAPAPTAPPERPLVDPVEAFVSFAKRRPSWFDLVMIVASALSYVSHGFGITSELILAWWLAWLFIWVGWAFVRSGLVGPVVSIATFMLILLGPQSWQLGFEIERECMEAFADEALASFERGQPDFGPGGCGLLRWRSSLVRSVRLSEGRAESDDGRSLVVQFRGGGTRSRSVFGDNGLVFSPDGEPTCRDLGNGEVLSCELSSLDDGWYHYSYRSYLG